MHHIRNFVILAHIDHGKSTLADRFLEITGTIEKRKMREQFLDMHPLEREKGITIKMQPVRMLWRFQEQEYILNLIDTPGHVDFTYEVSRALAAVEGGLLLVDATQGVQAQTLANLHLAQKEGVRIIPVINKIDLPSADVEKTVTELIDLLNVSRDEIYLISAKTGEGVAQLLGAIIEKIPPPSLAEASYGGRHPPRDREGELSVVPLRALVFDSLFDAYQGVIAHVRVFSGSIKKSGRVRFLASGARFDALEVGVFRPARIPVSELAEGEIGYIATGIKEPEQVRVGDTITDRETGVDLLPGYREPSPMVYASIFPENQEEYETLREALMKLKLEDAALVFEPEESSALGRGVRAGFLGMLHMEIISERLKREFGLELIFSNPSVAFRVALRSGEETVIYSAARMPQSHEYTVIKEPWAALEIITPPQFIGALTTLMSEREGRISEAITIGKDRLLVRCVAPLREVIIDLYDRLKSITQGFASMSYELSEWREADVVRLDILVAGERVNAFAEMVPREKVNFVGRARVEKLRGLIPSELFSIALQAEVEGRIIARETIGAMRKDVTGYLYGGDG